jgi:LacI family transcriptional regulator
MQLWFQCKRVPCLIAGSVHADLALPFCDLDFQAVCRHAVGVLHRLGHRRIALLSHTDRWAGEINSELGFMEGARAISGGAIIGTIRRHEEGAQSLAQALKSLLHGSERPTGIIVSSSYVYLTVAGLLAQNGLRIPQDVSLISRDDDPFLEAVVPSPTRYASNSRRFARKVLGSLLQLARGQTVTPLGTYLLPKLIIGDSTTRVK